MRRLTVTSFILSIVVSSSLVVVPDEPLCRIKNCPQSQGCRVVESCDNYKRCTLNAVCLPHTSMTYPTGGCKIGQPLLAQKAGGGFEMSTCYTNKDCHQGFYCSTVLQDVSSRCCRSNSVSPPKPGSCPAPDPVGDTNFCVDECLTDADCNWEAKCCPDSAACPKKFCQPPDPCSLQTCPSGFQCVVTPDHQADCVPQTPGPVPVHPLLPLSDNTVEPLCLYKNCPPMEVCRVLETCDLSNSCTIETICIPEAESSTALGGGCNIGEPLLVARAGGGLEMSTCYTNKNCRQGFYCSAALMDVASRCCRSNSVSPPKPGSCPAPDPKGDTNFCVDECLTDADCGWEAKCCPDSAACPKKFCQPPDPCSVMTCMSGYKCTLAPDQTAACVPVTPENPMLPRSMQPTNNHIPEASRVTCPYPWGPYEWGECDVQNTCGYQGAIGNCPQGQLCCATYHCGNICRWSVGY